MKYYRFCFWPETETKMATETETEKAKGASGSLETKIQS